MAKGPNIKAQVRRAIEGVRAGGLPIRRVVIKPDGEVDVIIGEPTGEQTGDNETESWLAKHALQRQGH